MRYRQTARLHAIGSLKSPRFSQSQDRRLEMMLGSACLILSVACVLLAGTLVSRGTSGFKTASAGNPNSTNQSASGTFDDAKLRDAVMQQLRGSNCCDKVTASVNDGVVTLNGEVREAVDRDAASYFAGNIAGVREVRNNLVAGSLQQGIATTTEVQPAIAPAANDAREATYRKRVIAAGEEPQQAKEAKVWIDGGENMLENGDYSRAIEYFNRALSADPGNARALRGLNRAKAAHEAETAVLRNRN